MKEGCSLMGDAKGAGAHAGHSGMQTAAVENKNATPRKVFVAPVQSVYDNYISIQESLAQDSLKGLSKAASAMTKAIHGDSKNSLSPKVAQQAEALAEAKDLAAAREAFKPLSESLIQYLKEQKVPAGTYYIAYCPMAKAGWLQTGKTVLNPYLGKSMLHCGEIKS